MAVINRTKLFEKYKGLWVALKQDRTTVVGSGKTLKEAVEEAERNGYSDPIMTRMPEKLIAFAGAGL